MEIRPAVSADLPALVQIYNYYVRASIATFDLDEFTVPQREEWFGHYGTAGPHRLFVAEDDEVVGYATSSPFRAKPGYRTSVEVSVYVAAGGHSRGTGSALYAALLRAVDEAGVHGCYAGIAMPNPASVALHRRYGFSPVGTFREVGSKFGELLDVQWFQRIRLVPPGQV